MDVPKEKFDYAGTLVVAGVVFVSTIAAIFTYNKGIPYIVSKFSAPALPPANNTNQQADE